MTAKIFIDTNILVYALDNFGRVRQAKCRQLLKRVTKDFSGVISTQVMQEFYVTATKKLDADPLIIKDMLHSFSRFEIVIITPELIQRAIDCQIINRISFWDALIVTAAGSARCEKLWTEDLNSGKIIQGVRIENPILLE